MLRLSRLGFVASLITACVDARHEQDTDAGSSDAADEEPVEPAVCGNGTVEVGERCDDGWLGEGDLCTDDCQPRLSLGDRDILWLH
jgi:cysteine-rich repeat protein